VLGIEPQQILNFRVPHDVKRVIDGKMSYLQFREKHGVESLDLVPTLALPAFVPKFLQDMGKLQDGWIHTQKKFEVDCSKLGVTTQVLAGVVLSNEIEKFFKEPNYSKFREKNGEDGIKIALQFNPTYQEKVKTVFSELSFREMEVFHQDNNSVIMLPSIKAVIESDAKEKTYADFKKKHHLDPLYEGILDQNHLQILKEKLLSEAKDSSYLTIKAQSREFNGASGLKIEDHEIENLLQADINSLSYIHFREKHTLQCIQDGIISADNLTTLREKLEKYLLERSFNQLVGYQNDCRLLNVDYLQIRKNCLERDLVNIESFESLIKAYGEVIFQEKLIQADSKKLLSLVVGYLSRSYEDLFAGKELKDFKTMQKYNLIPQEMLEAIDQGKRAKQEINKTYNAAVKEINEEFTDFSQKQAKEAADQIERLKKRFESDMDPLNKQLSSLKQDKTNCEYEIAKLQNDINTIPNLNRVIAETRTSLEGLPQTISLKEKALETAKKSSEELSKSVRELETAKIKKEQEPTTFIGYYTDPERSRLNSELKKQNESLKEAREQVKKIPTEIEALNKRKGDLQSILEAKTKELEQKKTEEARVPQLKTKLESAKRNEQEFQNAISLLESETREKKDHFAKRKEEIEQDKKDKMIKAQEDKERALNAEKETLNRLIKQSNQKFLETLVSLSIVRNH
jgi:hypothetical protein